MKIVVNVCFGGFSLSDECEAALGIDLNEMDLDVIDGELRTNPELITMVERDPAWAGGPYSELTVVEISDEATDWTIEEYDGMETIFACIGGRIYRY